MSFAALAKIIMRYKYTAADLHDQIKVGGDMCKLIGDLIAAGLQEQFDTYHLCSEARPRMQVQGDTAEDLEENLRVESELVFGAFLNVLPNVEDAFGPTLVDCIHRMLDAQIHTFQIRKIELFLDTQTRMEAYLEVATYVSEWDAIKCRENRKLFAVWADVKNYKGKATLATIGTEIERRVITTSLLEQCKFAFGFYGPEQISDDIEKTSVPSLFSRIHHLLSSK